jgi:hypothetical protein
VPLYLIAIAWTYITLLMALTEQSFVAGVATFVFYGLLPLALVLWLLASPTRKRRRRALEAAKNEASAPPKQRSALDPDD